MCCQHPLFTPDGFFIFPCMGAQNLGNLWLFFKDKLCIICSCKSFTMVCPLVEIVHAIFYITYISVDLALYEAFLALVG